MFSSHYSALDDVVLDYVVEVLTNLGDADESSFDVDQLCEMIAAYVPEFAQVDRYEISVCTLAAVGVEFCAYQILGLGALAIYTVNHVN